MLQTKIKPPILVARAALVMIVTVLMVCFGVGSTSQKADAVTSSTLNFQARLLTAAGAIVPDGNYNIEFKLYNAASSSGSSQGSCSGDAACVWKETRITTDKVRVVNGYLTVNLGSVETFSSSINWDQEHWLTMRIGGTGSPGWDGEMTPRLKLTAVPYAFRAGQLANTNGANLSTVGWATQTSSNSILLPNEGGTLCIQNSTNCGFLTTSSGGNYVQLQGSTPGTPQTGNLNVSGRAIAGTALQSPITYTNTIDSIAAAGTVSIGTTNATGGINLNQDTTLASGKLLTVQGAALFKNASNSATALEVRDQSNNTVFDVDTSNGRVGIGTNAPSRTLHAAINNTQTTAPMALLEQAGTGDASLEFKLPGKSFIVGQDASDSGKFKITSSTAAQGVATLGRTDVGTADTGDGNTKLATKFTAGASGSVTSMSVYINALDASTFNRSFSMAIYTDPGATGKPTTLLASAGTATAVVGWNTLSLSASITSGTTYWLTYWSNGDNNINYFTGGSSTLCFQNSAFTTWPGTYGASSCNGSIVSIYATYTPSGAYDSFSTSLFALGDTGQAVFQNSTNSTTAFQVQNAAGNSILSVDTSNSGVILGKASTVNGKMTFQNSTNTNTATIQSGATSTSYTLTLPTALGSSGSCLADTNGSGVLGFVSCVGSATTLQGAYDAGNVITTTSARSIGITLADTATDSNFTINMQCTTCSTDGGRFEVQNAGTAAFWLNPGSAAGQRGSAIFRNTANDVNAFRIQTAGGGSTVFNVDTTNARVGINNAAPNYALDVTGDINSSTAIRVGNTVVCDTTGATGCVAKSGTGYYIHNQTTVQAANMYVQAATTGTVAAKFQAFNGGSGNIVEFLNGTGTTVGSISSTGSVLIKPSTNSANAFQVQPSGSTTPVLNVDTSNSYVGLGTATPSRTLHVAVNNTQTTAPSLLLEQAGTGDSSIEFKNTGSATSFYIGQDTSNSGAFSINSSTAATSTQPVSFIQTAAVSNDAASTTTVQALSSNTVAGDLIVVSASWDIGGSNNIQDAECTDSQGNTYAVAIKRVDTDPSEHQAVAICYAVSGSSAADTVTVTYKASGVTTAAGFRRVLIATYRGVATSSPLDVTAGQTNVTVGAGTDTVTSTSATTTQSGELVFGVSTDLSNATTITAGAGFTQRNSLNAKDIAIQDMVQSNAGSVASTMTFGVVGHPYTALMATFKPATSSLTDTFSNSLFSLSQTGSAKFQNATNSTAAFQIQNATGTALFNVDSTNSILTALGAVGVGAAGDSTIALKVVNNSDTQVGLSVAATSATQSANIAQFTGASSRSLVYNPSGSLVVTSGTNQTASAATFTLGNTSGTLTNGLQVNRSGAGGTTTSGININQSAGTLTNGLSFSGTIGTDINRSSGILSLQGTGGITLTAGGTTTLALDTAGAGTITVGGTNATSLNLGTRGNTKGIQIGAITGTGTDTIGIGNNATASSVSNVTMGNLLGASTTTIQAGTGNINLNVNQTGAGVTVRTLTNNSTTAFQVQNAAGTSNLLVADTVNNVLKVGTTSLPTLSGAVLFATSSEVGSIIRIGDATDGFEFDKTNGITYRGTGRPTKRFTLVPEFAGGTMTAPSGCSTCTGSMSSDVEPAAGASALPGGEGVSHNFYSWTTTQATNQQYDIWASFSLPSDFSAFASPTNPFFVWSKTTDTTNGTITMQIYDANRSPAFCFGGASDTAASVTPTSANAWQERQPGNPTTDGCAFVANDRIQIRFRVQAPQNGTVKLGELRFDYLAKF